MAAKIMVEKNKKGETTSEKSESKMLSDKIVDFLTEKEGEEKSNPKKYFLIFALLIFGLVTLSMFQTSDWVNRESLNASKQLMTIIDDYKEANGNLPEQLDDMNVDDVKVDGLSYEKISESEYEISFVTEAGTKVVYNSVTGKWQ